MPSNLVIIANFVVVLLSLLGWALLVYHRFIREAAFSFMGAIGAVITLLFVFGLLRLLFWGYLLVLLAGLGFLAVYLVQVARRRVRADFFLEPPVYVFLLFAVVFAVLYHRLVCYVADEYSHWAPVAKEILRFDSLPDARSVVSYTNYPPATALFLYFAMRLTGFCEGWALAYNSLIALAGLCTLLAGCRFNRPVGLVLRLLMMGVLLTLAQQWFSTLLVDHVLGLVGMAFMVMVFWVFRRPGAAGVWQMAALSAVACGLILIKSSGVSFVAAGWLLAGILALANRGKKEKSGAKTGARRALPVVFLVLLPFILLLCWRVYVDLAYPGSGYSANKFALTEENFAAAYGSKSQEMLDGLPGLFAKTLFGSNMTRVCALAFGMLLAVTLLQYVRHRRWDWHGPGAALVGVGLWGVYNVGYYFMLRYLMPAGEMQGYIAGFSRYELSVAVAVAGLLLFAAAAGYEEGLQPLKKWWSYGVAAAMCVACLPFVGLNLVVAPYDDPGYRQHEQVDEVYNAVPRVYDHTSGLVFYIGDYVDDASVFNNHTYMGKYLVKNVANFGNTSVNGQPFEGQLLLDTLRDKDYLVLQEQDGALFDLLEALGISFDSREGLLYRVVWQGEAVRIERIQ